ncbi:class I tRNA ligase family protein, partial [Pseudomonas aeruginosa]|uniref:class I tRNA ligase family protein n=1 Tax=Pseudomonas aeruginosa TaxID=287 RepID=UPI001298D600
RSTFRFLLGNLDDFKPSENTVAVAELREVDRYMLVKLNDLITKVKEAYETYDFAAVYHAIHNFCTIDLSSFYLDFAKDILYIEGANHEDRRAIQTVLYDVLVALTKLVTPILPHTADEVWPYVPGVTEESV